jgi:hypothetical protein
MPALEIFEEPLPSPMALSGPNICSAPCCTQTAGSHRFPTRYAVAQAAPAVATASDEQPPARPFSNLTIPTPMADPAAMVVQLFEKLKDSEDRAAEARHRLAEAQAELAVLRNVSAAPRADHSATLVPIVMLQMQCFEIELDAVAASDVELTGVCRQELSQNGLAALVARGAFANCCSSSETACGAEHQACPCTGCSDCPGQQTDPPAAPAATDKASSCCDSHQFADDAERLGQVVDQLKRAGLLRHISHPRLMTRSGETARMSVGRQIAFRTAGQDGDQATQQVSFCTAGTEIEVRPVAEPSMGGGTVQIELRARWSAIDEAASRDNGQPILMERAVESIVELPAGKTAVVAGLVEQQQPEADQPHARGRSEFVVLITPRLVMPLASAATDEAPR